MPFNGVFPPHRRSPPGCGKTTLLRELLDSDRTLVATVALKGGGFIAEVKGRGDCALFELYPENREDVLQGLNDALAERLSEKVVNSPC